MILEGAEITGIGPTYDLLCSFHPLLCVSVSCRVYSTYKGWTFDDSSFGVAFSILSCFNLPYDATFRALDGSSASSNFSAKSCLSSLHLRIDPSGSRTNHLR